MCAAKPIQGAIGASNRPVYIAADGTITPIAGAIGGATQPIYVNGSGQLVAGNAPMYSYTPTHATAAAAGVLKTVANASFVGTDANGDLIAVTPPDTDHGIGPSSLSNYTEVVPYWGYTLGNELVSPAKGETIVAPSPYNAISCYHTNETDSVYEYTVSIPTWTDGKTKMLSIDFCCLGGNESLEDMRVWLVSGSARVNILKQHAFNYGYKVSGEVTHTNQYSSCNQIIPIKSGVNLQFVSANKVRHAHILLFNV